MFDLLLREIRNKKSLSQSDTINILSQLTEFDKLDKVTYSRWENGHTRPSEAKQILAIMHLDSVKTARILARSFTLKNEHEYKTIQKRFVPAGTRITDNFYLPPNSLSKKTVYKKSGINTLILDTYKHLWGHDYNDFHNKMEVCGINSYSISEFYIENDHLAGHQIIYLTNINSFNTVLEKLNLPFITDTIYQKESDNIVVVACSYSSSEIIFLQNILDVLEYCEENDFISKFLYLRLHNTTIKKYAESLGGTISTYGPKSKMGIEHFASTYSWLGMLIPMASIIKQSHVYESILKFKTVP